MIRDGTRYMLVAPHMVLAPGLTLMLVVLATNLLGDRLRDYMDVRVRFSYSSTKSVKKTASMLGVPVSATITS